MKKNIILTVCFIFIVCLSLILIGVLDNKEVNIIEESTLIKDEEGNVSNINLTEGLHDTLRELIPKLSICNTYLFKQYKKGAFYYYEVTSDDYTNDYDGCTTNIKVYTKEKSISTKLNNVFIEDYVLLYDGKYYGTDIDNMNITLTIDITDDVIEKYGKVYTYTFTNTGDMYMYNSTSYTNQ